MTMKDWIEHVDRILAATGENLLDGNGEISHNQMTNKVEKEYKKYQANTLSKVERDYLKEIKNIETKVKNSKKGGKE